MVFIGPYEHHSNELPWRESIADVVTIDEDSDGRIDLGHLARELETYRDRPLRIGSFSAASNVTGIGSDIRSITALLHRHGALSFWDFAAAGPYVRIEMNRKDDLPDGDLLYKDAIFLSPHKFIGGPGTPGLLVAKRHLFKNRVPTVPGGGTVAYVSSEGHDYLRDGERVDRELVGPEPAELEVTGGLEDEPRQEDSEEQLLRQMRRRKPPRPSGEEPRDHERDRVRDLEPAREQRDGGRERQEPADCLGAYSQTLMSRWECTPNRSPGARRRGHHLVRPLEGLDDRHRRVGRPTRPQAREGWFEPIHP